MLRPGVHPGPRGKYLADGSLWCEECQGLRRNCQLGLFLDHKPGCPISTDVFQSGDVGLSRAQPATLKPAATLEANVSVFLKRFWMFGVAGGSCLLQQLSTMKLSDMGHPGLWSRRPEFGVLTHPLKALNSCNRDGTVVNRVRSSLCFRNGLCGRKADSFTSPKRGGVEAHCRSLGFARDDRLGGVGDNGGDCFPERVG